MPGPRTINSIVSDLEELLIELKLLIQHGVQHGPYISTCDCEKNPEGPFELDCPCCGAKAEEPCRIVR